MTMQLGHISPCILKTKDKKQKPSRCYLRQQKRMLLGTWLMVLVFMVWGHEMGFGQFLPDRYQMPIYTDVIETTDILFSTQVPQPNPGGGFYEGITGLPVNVTEYETTDVDLYMNIFEPAGDTISFRPVVIICFGGGFVAGSKDHWSMRLIAEELARLGYVTAVIDYRLGMNVFDQDLAKRAVYRGLQDGRSAVRFFKADAAGDNQYRIDPEHIYIGGHSAGAFIALHNGYLDKESERPPSTYEWEQSCGFLGTSTCTCPDLGCLDCAGDHQDFDGHARALFSLAGAVGAVEYIETSSDPSVVLFHSADDGTVPIDEGEPFGDISFLIVGSDLPEVYGSQLIADRAEDIMLPHEYYAYTNRGHGVHEETDQDLYADIIPNITTWFYEHLLKPEAISLDGDEAFCPIEPFKTYTLNGNGVYFDWIIEGGTIINPSILSPTVEVEWDVMAETHSISVTPYGLQWGAGDTFHLDVDKTPVGTMNNPGPDPDCMFLSIDWQSFQARAIGEDVILRWAVWIESDEAEFVLQRYDDDWHTLDTVITSHAGQHQLDYVDRRPGAGFHMYRIVYKSAQVAPSISPIRVAQIDEAYDGITVYPIPTDSELFIQIDQDIDMSDITIYTVSGRKVHHHVIGGDRSVTLDVGDLPAGSYLLRTGRITKLFNKM